MPSDMASETKMGPQNGVTNKWVFSVFWVKFPLITQISTENESGLKQRESDFKKWQNVF